MTDYSKYWDVYYSNLEKNGNLALWDVEASRAAAADLSTMLEHMDPQLPLIDLGCGVGTQSKYFAQHFDTVIAVDVSQVALKKAQSQSNHDNIEYQWLKNVEHEVFQELHQRYGDANIYMRGVIHQIKSEDLPAFNINLKTVLGDKGKLYFVEVGEGIREYFTNSSDSFSRLPRAMKQAFLSNLPPIGLSIANLSLYFDADIFKSLCAEDTFLNTNLKFMDSQWIKIPALKGIIKVND